MKRITSSLLLILTLLCAGQSLSAQQRRPIDNQHPLWFIHVDVWYKADPQKIIDLIPEDIRPYVCLNLSLSCQYDTEKNIYKMPQNAVRTYKSWATVCQHNGMWFTCQPASGGHTHIQDYDLETFEYFFKRFPNFLGWNYAEQFWGFDEAGDKSSSTQASRLALFAKLVPMSHKYGGFLTVSFCGNIWSHLLNPMGMMKRNKDLLQACKDYPEAMLWLYKYTTSSCFYNNESVTFGPYISGLAKNYGVRYDNCGWNEALDAVLGKNHGKKYPAAAGIGTVMEQTGMNGGAVWDGPELTWREECFHEVNNTTVNGYKRRNWAQFDNFKGVWLDMFRKITDGTLYIPTREEVLEQTKIVIVNDVSSGDDEARYATWGSLYDGLYKQTDPFNRGNGQWMDNLCYFKSTGRYGTIPMVIGLYDEAAKNIPVQVKKSTKDTRWNTQTKKVNEFNEQYAEVSTGDLFVRRLKNQLVTYTPYSYLNKKTTAQATIPLQYNTCDALELTYDKLSSGLIREYADHIDFYLNNYRSDSTTQRTDIIVVQGATTEPTYELNTHVTAKASATASFDGSNYTLTVKHCGAVDLTIHCAGNADRTGTEATAIAISPLPLPQQPAEYHGEIQIEAEDMDFKNIKACVTDPYGQDWGAYNGVRGQAGNGFMDMGSSTSGALRHQLTLKQGGDYTVAIRYTCATKGGNATVSVNGTRQTVALSQTAKNEWLKATLTTPLQEGTNDLVITNSGGLPMYIDQIIYTPVGVEPEKFLVNIREAEGGTVTTTTTEAAEGETVTLTVQPNEGFQLKELRVINSVYYTQQLTLPVEPGVTELTFTMLDDNVTIQPVFADMTAIYKLDLTDVLTGTIPQGWRTVQENNDVHQYPNSYGSGARTFAGFTGYQGKALYWREGTADYGRQAAYPLTLEPGSYKLTFAVAAWKASPKYKVRILDTKGNTVAESDTYTAAPNANGSTTADLTATKEYELPFCVAESGKYIISFTKLSNSSGYDEYLLLECNVNAVDTPDAIGRVTRTPVSAGIYSLSGQKRQSLQRGVNIVVTPDGQSRCVLVK